jgi:hypothetical protein
VSRPRPSTLAQVARKQGCFRSVGRSVRFRKRCGISYFGILGSMGSFNCEASHALQEVVSRLPPQDMQKGVWEDAVPRGGSPPSKIKYLMSVYVRFGIVSAGSVS